MLGELILQADLVEGSGAYFLFKSLACVDDASLVLSFGRRVPLVVLVLKAKERLVQVALQLDLALELGDHEHSFVALCFELDFLIELLLEFVR